jgi:transcriptional repressor of dcmA and dcmR
MTVKEAAVFFNVSEMTIRRWTNSGTLNCYRVGGKRERRFRAHDLQSYLDRLSSQGTETNTMVSLGGPSLFVPDGTHLTHLSVNFSESLDVGSAYLREGLHRGETVLLVAGKDNLDKLCNRLELSGVDVEIAKSQERLHISHGAGDPLSMATLISQTIAAAKGNFRLFGDMTWVKEKKWRLETTRQLEEMGNNFLSTSGCLYLCQYPLASFSGEELMMVAETHKYTLYKSLLRKSPYFTIN